jgi:hypothetical protein
MTLIEEYKVRLDQLLKGSKELYEGELDTVREILSNYGKRE